MMRASDDEREGRVSATTILTWKLLDIDEGSWMPPQDPSATSDGLANRGGRFADDNIDAKIAELCA